MRLPAIALALTVALGVTSSALARHDSASLYSVDLTTGEATEIGPIGTYPELIGLAAAEVDGETVLYGVSTTNQLITFTPETPGSLEADAQLSGLAPGVDIIGIDVRPATGELFGIGDDNVLYVIDVETGEVTAIGTGIDPVIDGTMIGFDFNPTVDRIRLTTNTGQNLRLNPETGVVGTNPDTGEATIDGDIAFADDDDNAGGGVAVVGSAYTNSVADAEETQLFVISDANDVLALQDPPNDGTLNTVGELGIDVSQVVGFDITPAGDAYLAANAD
ncbi:MAG: DUF4394 domain-containing protein [Chloroflexota bacterium]|nr:DUF4394 domain-containing protein [Chloroflexota bacterium]